MKRIIITILQGDKYPAQYADTMAEFLQRFDVELWVYTDSTHVFTHAVKHETRAWPSGWWGKMMLYDPETTGLDDVLFCDVDTLFLKDPTPIFEWIEEIRPDAAFISDFLPHPGYESKGYKSTSLFYLNHREKKTRFIYVWYMEDLADHSIPVKTERGLLYGDQEYVTDALFDNIYKVVGKDPKVQYFPTVFQAQHKALFWQHQLDQVTHGRNWRDVWRGVWRQYGGLTLEDFISITFMATRNVPGVCPQYKELMSLLTKLNHPFLKLIEEVHHGG